MPRRSESTPRSRPTATERASRYGAADASAYVAVGDDNGSGVSWVSSDGRTWQAAAPSQSLAAARMDSVRWLGSEFVATGETSAGDGVAWESSDGKSWVRLDTGSIFHAIPIQGAAAVGSRILLFGPDEAQQLVVAVTAAAP